MDNQPFSTSPAEPEQPLSVHNARLVESPNGNSLTPVSPKSAGRESPLRDVFLGPEGIYPGTRWLIYLALAWTVFQLEGWLLVSLRSSLGVLWWRMIIEANMMLAAVLPGFVMARIEGRPFGDFGLPPRGAFRRNF